MVERWECHQLKHVTASCPENLRFACGLLGHTRRECRDAVPRGASSREGSGSTRTDGWASGSIHRSESAGCARSKGSEGPLTSVPETAERPQFRRHNKPDGKRVRGRVQESGAPPIGRPCRNLRRVRSVSADRSYSEPSGKSWSGGAWSGSASSSSNQGWSCYFGGDWWRCLDALEG